MRTRSFILASIFLSLAVTSVHAQIELNTGGSVAIGASPVNQTKLRVVCSASTGCQSNNVRAIHAQSTGDWYLDSRAVYAVANGNAFNSYGVYASASGYNSYGIYATSSATGAYNYAGYFNGSVYSTGSYLPSDARLKVDVRYLREEGAVAKLLQLQPRRYRYRTTDELRSAGLPGLQLAEGEHLGLLAQEVEEVFPELIIDVAHPPAEDEEVGETREVVTTKAINYIELIPVLIEAIREQQEEIEALRRVVQERR